MTISELSERQKAELRWALYLDNIWEGELYHVRDRWSSPWDITENELEDTFGFYDFSEDDFGVSMGQTQEEYLKEMRS